MPTTSDILIEDLEAIIGNVSGWKSFAGQTVLITGAAGFLGNYLVRTLLQLNTSGTLTAPVHVIACVRDSATTPPRLAGLEDLPELSLLALDLSRIALPQLPAVDYVIHAASHASPRFYGTDPVGTLLPNTVGTAALLAACGGGLKGFLFISSSEIYGSAGGEGVLHEATPGVMDSVLPRSCYGEGKRAGEALCIAWYEQFGVPAYIARPFHTYGPGLAADDGRVFADFVHNAINGEDIQIHGDGEARRAFCYVSDAIAGFFTILFQGKPGQAYNVANPDAELSVRELAELTLKLSPVPGLSVRLAQGSHRGGYIPSTHQRLLPDVSKLKALGWHPKLSPEAGFQRTIEAQL